MKKIVKKKKFTVPLKYKKT